MPSKLTYSQIESRFHELDSREAKVRDDVPPQTKHHPYCNNFPLGTLSAQWSSPPQSTFVVAIVLLCPTPPSVAEHTPLPLLCPPLLFLLTCAPQLREFYAPTTKKTKRKTAAAAAAALDATPRHRYAGSLIEEDDAGFWVEQRGK